MKLIEVANFASLPFLFRFLPLFLILWQVCPRAWQDGLLFAGSLLFYGSAEPRFLPLFLVLILLNHVLGEASFDQKGRNVLALSVVLDVSFLLLVKVAAVASDRFSYPMGISFFLFKMLSFQADVHSGVIRERPGFLQTAAYFSMFPQVAEGPIMRYGEGFGKPRPRPSLGAIEEGLRYFLFGLAMKVCLADRLAALWEELYRTGYEAISTPLAWIGLFLNSFRIYFDFWGYSLMAGGLGVMLGFPMIRNFRHPYAAVGAADYYRRWHITLGTFFRDYVYIPLGGSREGKIRTCRNLAIVWLLTGLWHGIRLNYLLWSMVLFCLVAGEKFLYGRFLIAHRWAARIYLWVLIPLTWLLFSLEDLPDLGAYLGRLFPFLPGDPAVSRGDWAVCLADAWPYLLASVLLCVPKVYDLWEKHRRSLPVTILLFGLGGASVYLLALGEGNPFLYFHY